MPLTAPTLSSSLHLQTHDLTPPSHPHSPGLGRNQRAEPACPWQRTKATLPGWLVLTLPWTEVLQTTSEPSPPQLMGPFVNGPASVWDVGIRRAPPSPGSCCTSNQAAKPTGRRKGVIYGRGRGGRRGAVQTGPVNSSPSSADHKNKQSPELQPRPVQHQPRREGWRDRGEGRDHKT